MKTKIKSYCSFSIGTCGTKLKFLDADLKLNLRKCLDEMLPLRVFQMEKMVMRSDRNATIMMNVATPQDQQHINFNKLLCHQYTYNKGNMDKVSGYVYSLLEAICFQSGFFTWEDIRKYIILIIINH